MLSLNENTNKRIKIIFTKFPFSKGKREFFVHTFLTLKIKLYLCKDYKFVKH